MNREEKTKNSEKANQLVNTWKSLWKSDTDITAKE